ncbi:MAG: nucleotidyltransferase family protein [Hydrogenophaga sp.]
MILAAGRGARMRPLTDTCPKPLLEVHGRPLMEWPMQALFDQGFKRLTVNTAWLGDQIENRFADWPAMHPGAHLNFSNEGRDFGGALETAGGIARALPLLGEVFWVLAGDVFAPDFVFDTEAVRRFENSQQLAHLWLVPNPAHNPQGDFGLSTTGLVLNNSDLRLTYSTIGLYRRALFETPWLDLPSGNPLGVSAALAPLLRSAIAAGRVSGSVYTGAWTDVGTPDRLADLNRDCSLGHGAGANGFRGQFRPD